jgi:hypothetical protein
VGKKVPTLECILPFLGVWNDQSGIWIPLLKISLHRFQSVPTFAKQVIEIKD